MALKTSTLAWLAAIGLAADAGLAYLYFSRKASTPANAPLSAPANASFQPAGPPENLFSIPGGQPDFLVGPIPYELSKSRGPHIEPLGDEQKCMAGYVMMVGKGSRGEIVMTNVSDRYGPVRCEFGQRVVSD